MSALLRVMLAAAPLCDEAGLAKVASRLHGLPWDSRDSEAARGVLTHCSELPAPYVTGLQIVALPWRLRALARDLLFVEQSARARGKRPV